MDKEEKSLEHKDLFGESSIKEEEEEAKSDGNNTDTQKKVGIDINMIRAKENRHWGKPEVRQKKCPPQQMSP